MKNILITGGASGLGFATAKYFADKDYFVWVCDIKTGESYKNINYIKTDLTKSEDVKQAFDVVSKSTKSLDAIIHFAGIYVMSALTEIEEAVLKKMLDVNLLGCYRVNKQFLPLVQSGKIIIITSEVAPLKPIPFNSIYSLTKTALDCYAHALRMELSLLNIPVITVRPGAFSTQLLGASINSMEDFCKNTKLYKHNAQKFRKIMSSNMKSKPAEKLAKLIFKINKKKSPKSIYKINNNISLKLLNLLPSKCQSFVYKKLLKENKKTH